MTTNNNGSFLKDVVAYVDVWSSDKTANCSKPFIKQLQEMGAQVSKTFTKQVTHVVFKNGHPATWRKAKKREVKLVSVLWVGRCHEEGAPVSEELFPAMGEINPLLRNKKHRCMQPKDSPERTPENDRRMKRKLDKMMKDLVPQQPIVTDVSPIIIDEESGIVYSPGLKRSDYMAQRLKDMKEKRENLSPTASQMIESSSPVGMKPSLGSTPTHWNLQFDQSDDDSTTSAVEPAYSPDKEEERKLTVTEHGDQHQRTTSVKPWLSALPYAPKCLPSLLKCPDFSDLVGNAENTPDKKPAEKQTQKSRGLSESPRKEDTSDSHRSFIEETRQSQRRSSRPSRGSPINRKTKIATDKYLTETESHIIPENVNSPNISQKGKKKETTKFIRSPVISHSVNSSSCLSSPVGPDDAAAKCSKETFTPLGKKKQRTSRPSRLSASSLAQSAILLSSTQSVASNSAGGDVFEDYFSPAHNHRETKRHLLPDLPVEGSSHMPFELDSILNKRKRRRCESIGSVAKIKKKKPEINDKGKNQKTDAEIEHQSPSCHDVEASLPRTMSNVTHSAKKGRESILPTTTNTDAAKQRRASTSSMSELIETNATSELKKSSLSNTVEHGGSVGTVAAGVAENLSEDEDDHKQVSLRRPKMANKKLSTRTLVMTSMPTEKQNIVVQVVTTLGGFSIVEQVCESTTHVVSWGHRRTLNILLGIARGCWIVSFDWILWCLEQRQWIPEEPYELSDHFPAAQICRLQRHLSAGEHQQDLFQNQPPMFVSQHSQPPTQNLVELIQLCGGTVCKTVRQAGICIGKYSGRIPQGSRVLSEQWVLDSITCLKQLSYDDYILE